jgi:hypothetical protein
MPTQDLGFGWVEACSILAEEIARAQNGPGLAVQLLEDDWEIEARVGPEGVIELLEPIPARAEPLLCRALGLSNEDGPVAATGAFRGNARAVAIWSAPHLVIEKRSTRRWGDLYELPESLSPLTFTSFESELPRPTASWQGDEPPPATAADLLSVFEDR